MEFKAEIKKTFTGPDKLRAVCSVVLDDCFLVKNVRVVEGEKGLFVSLPSRRNVKGEWVEHCFPIYGEIVESRKKNGTPILKTTGVSRSGCMYCMYGVHLEHEPNRFQLMQVTHPQQYDYCINKLGCGAVLDYIGVPYRNQQLEVDHC